MKKLIPKSEWGEALHTALRKCCDSSATTIAYQAIAQMSSGWTNYLDHVRKAFKPSGVSIPAALKAASLSWKWQESGQRDRESAIILHCSFDLFEDGDWEGFASFLEEEK